MRMAIMILGYVFLVNFFEISATQGIMMGGGMIWSILMDILSLLEKKS